MLVTTHVTILKTYDYSDTSKILRCLTRDHGLRSVIAKGARRPKSRFGGLVEPFSDGIATFYLKEGRDLYTLSSFELTKERQALGRDLVRFAGAGLLTELALRFAPASQDRRLFAGLRRGLDRLVTDPGDSAAVVLQEVWGMIAVLGFRPSVARCVFCDREIPETEGGAFDAAAGGLRCRRCARAGDEGAADPARSGRAIHLTATARRELRILAGPTLNGAAPPAPLEPLQTTRVQRALLREFLGHHLAEERPLNALGFLERQLG